MFVRLPNVITENFLFQPIIDFTVFVILVEHFVNMS